MAPVTNPIRHPRTSSPQGYTAAQVAHAYGLPAGYDGTGTTVGLIELGGAVNFDDLTALGVDTSKVTCISVDGGQPSSDGPDGADGEVMLDVEVVASIAPGAHIRVYFADNTSDTGFLNAIVQAGAECDTVSISWGGPENSWDPQSIKQFSAAFATLRAHGVLVTAAAGDSGADDGTNTKVVDYPAADPNVLGCGGTRLTLHADGTRAAEVTWNDDPHQSATGGGVSKLFPGRAVPDVAGNADPDTGYQVVTDRQSGVAGGTSAVAPLYAAAFAVLKQRLHGKAFDFLNAVLTNPTVCYDVTVGDNGGYKAGPGRDDVTGLGVVDFGKLLAVLSSGTQVPAPGGNTDTGTTTPPTTGGTATTTPPASNGTGSTAGGGNLAALDALEAELETWLADGVAWVRKLKTELGG